jgi:electron transport complex protein RnfC
LPTDVGVLLFDAIAAAELAAIERDEPFELPLVIDDPLLGQRHRLSATPSTTVGAALTAAGLSWQGKRLFHGPLLRRFAVDPAVPVGETELWLHVESAMAAVPSAACTRCGDCVAACPVDLHPAALLEAAQAGDREMAQAFAASACIDCGLCSHVCPSRLPIMESIRLLKRPPAEAAR